MIPPALGHKANGVLSSIAPPPPAIKNSRLRAAISLLLPLLLPFLNQSKTWGCPIFAAVLSPRRWECTPSPSQLLSLPLFLRVTCSLSATPNVISTEGGALCRRSGEIPVFRLCSCLCPCSFLCPFSCLCRFRCF